MYTYYEYKKNKIYEYKREFYLHNDQYKFINLLHNITEFNELFKQPTNETFVNKPSYPPYNIVKIDDYNYQIEIACAGFNQDDIEITKDDNKLIIKGKQSSVESTYIYKGISSKQFERKFVLGEHINIENATYINGILTIDLKNEMPEENKPKVIPITTTSQKE